MKKVHIFNHDMYHHTLKHQIGSGIPVFSGIRQRGGGLGGVLGFVGRYAIPLLSKYVIPHVRKALIGTAVDLITNNPIKKTVKQNIRSLAKNVGSDIVQNIGVQKGKGITRKNKNQLSTTISTKQVPSKKPKTVSKSKKKNVQKKKSKPSKKTKNVGKSKSKNKIKKNLAKQTFLHNVSH